MLADCLPRLTMGQRFELGSQWSGFVAAWRLDAAPRPHRSVQIEQNREPVVTGMADRNDALCLFAREYLSWRRP